MHQQLTHSTSPLASGAQSPSFSLLGPWTITMIVGAWLRSGDSALFSRCASAITVLTLFIEHNGFPIRSAQPCQRVSSSRVRNFHVWLFSKSRSTQWHVNAELRPSARNPQTGASWPRQYNVWFLFQGIYNNNIQWVVCSTRLVGKIIERNYSMGGARE
ncbi:hypothetical protein DFH06DRAFT_357004 [Mycena polygramma]|nr:hypothetical protein DFH06DRAFT_357004 [Mycena polygramma]